MKRKATYNIPVYKGNILHKPHIIIAIDPDAEKNGVATLHINTRKMTMQTLSFPETLDYLLYIKRQCEVTNEPYIVVIEAGWLNKGNWHLINAESHARAAAKGNSVGRNHETGRKLVEMCEHWEIPHDIMKPLVLRIKGRNIWQGKDGKITHDELAAITPIKTRTNQEERDAALIAWHYANLPLTKNLTTFVKQK